MANNVSLLSNRKITQIVVHCSDSEYGHRAEIDRWHKARRWRGIGYHFVVLNPYQTYEDYKLLHPNFDMDGVLEEGRDINEVGSHVKGFNAHSIGICMIGRRVFTGMQFRTCKDLISTLLIDYPEAQVIGHCELDDEKSCPNIDMDDFRDQLRLTNISQKAIL